MSRKNKYIQQSVLSYLSATESYRRFEWQSLRNVSHSAVLDTFRTSICYLNFGHPEGFGLPIAEAMASGCWVVGYSGGGGRELFRFGGSEQVPFGDWTAFVQALQRAFTLFADQPRETDLRLQRQALAVRSLYGRSQERATVEIAWQRIEEIFSQWLKNPHSVEFLS